MKTPPHRSVVSSLPDAVSALVKPGMHLNFSSMPSRSNAAIREVARQWRGRDPGFELSATGFHSTAHLLGALRLGRRYISAFFGDNYPIPRPNALWERVRADGAELEFWSLWSYVSALRAGALGQRWATTRSLVGTSMGADLARAGRFRTVQLPDAEAPLGLVAALRPDVTFVHALMGDRHGNVVFSPPQFEGPWGALAAREGVIVTVERIVETDECVKHPDSMPIPPHRVLAVCEAPHGAHPQPFFVLPRFGEGSGYPDDFAGYGVWRRLAEQPAEVENFVAEVLDAPEPERAYRTWVAATTGWTPAPPPPRTVAADGWPPDLSGPFRPAATLLVLAARRIAARVRARGYRVVLAGIGQSFFASRLARILLAREGIDVTVMVETGLFDVECGPLANDFLLSWDNMARARRITGVEDVLGAITCGADNGCLAVVGAAQVDASGAVNSTWIRPDRLLVGSGGANDIASAAEEVVVLARCSATRLVRRVDYVTSPGRRVLTIVTDRCVLSRRGPLTQAWAVDDVYLHPGETLERVRRDLREVCTWELGEPFATGVAPVIRPEELRALRELDPKGIYWSRERPDSNNDEAPHDSHRDSWNRKLPSATDAHDG